MSGVRAQLAGLQRPVQLHPQDPGDRREHGPVQDQTAAGKLLYQRFTRVNTTVKHSTAPDQTAAGTVTAIYQSKHHSKRQYGTRSDRRRYCISDLPE